MFYVRRVCETETAAELEWQAHKAEAHGYPFGVTIWRVVESSEIKHGERYASCERVHEQFPQTTQSGSDPAHYTLVFPGEITAAVAERFATLFRSFESADSSSR